MEGSFGSAISLAATDELIEAIKNGDPEAIENINFQYWILTNKFNPQKELPAYFLTLVQTESQEMEDQMKNSHYRGVPH